MPVPLTPWSRWFETTENLAPHAAALGAAVAELRRRHPARRAFWGDDFAWELAATGLADDAARAVETAARGEALLRVEVNPQSPGPVAAHDGSARSVLLASTPRTGNTIVRRMIGQLGPVEYALHDLDDLHWEAASRPFVVQHHIGPGPRARSFLSAERAVAVTVVRHPLDVLCSVRGFTVREPACRYWLDGAAGLAGVSLVDDDDFEAWAVSDAADRLLAVSTDWAAEPDVTVIRHEDVVADRPGVFGALAATIGVVPPADADERFQEASGGIPERHRTAPAPGAWRQLPGRLVSRLADRHARHLSSLGYDLEDSRD